MSAAPAVETDDAAFQRTFAAALLGGSGSSDLAWADAPGFAVYRNTVARGLVDALAANFPTVRSLVGEEAFHDVARAHALASPPREPSLAGYGAGFPAFLGPWLVDRGAADELPYLVDVARLDRLWTECHLARDAVPAMLSDLAGVAADTLLGHRFRPHPAARRFACVAVPAFTIWRRHREHGDLGAPLDWLGEAGLLTRPQGEVRWCPLTTSEACALDALWAGETLGSALEHVDDSDAATGAVARWLDAGAFLAPEGAR